MYNTNTNNNNNNSNTNNSNNNNNNNNYNNNNIVTVVPNLKIYSLKRIPIVLVSTLNRKLMVLKVAF